METERKATNRQTWAIFCATGYDVRECDLTLAGASEIITASKKGTAFDPPQGAIQKRKGASHKKSSYAVIYTEAHAAGMEGLKACVPTRMLVVEHENQLDDTSPAKKTWEVAGGVCGSAGVWLRDGRKGFARWLTTTGKAYKDNYLGGTTIIVREGGQSMERKVAYAREFVAVLEKYNISSSVRSRID